MKTSHDFRIIKTHRTMIIKSWGDPSDNCKQNYKQMKNIMVAIDTDEQSAELVDYAIELARKFDAKIWIVHIVTPDMGYVGVVVSPQYVSTLKKSEHKAEHQLLLKYEARVKYEGLEAEGILITGPTVEMVVEEALKLKADLIVIGSHEHSFLHNALVGNTTRQVIRKSGIPVLVVPIL